MITDCDEIQLSGTTTTGDIVLKGFNLTAATGLSIEGDNASMFSTSVDSVSASDANAEDGKTVTVTFTPGAAEAGDYEATLRITNATDNVSMLVTLKGTVA